MTMEYKDYYNILGISRDAGADAVKQAYRKLARKYHPDVNKDKDAEARFKDIGEAYEVLKDPEKRAAYDRFGADWQNGEQFRPPPDWNAGYEFHGNADPRGFSDFFEALFGQARARGEQGGYGGQEFRMRGEDQQAAITIALEDACHGAKQTLTLNRPVLDKDGRVSMRPQQLNLAIPKGIIAGQRIRLEGQGMPGHGGGPAGDLYLEIHFAPHPLFTVEQRDIHLQLPVTPWEAALGASLTVPTLDGKVQLRIPPNSQNGRKLRLKGKGLSTATKQGDQIVTLQVVLPEAHTEAQQALYREMAATMPFNPRTDLGV